MRSFLTYGLISFVGVAALYACGDDDGGGGNTAGTGGMGGSAGMGGGGAAGMAGQGGGGASGMGGGGAAGAPATAAPASNCTGCVQLSVNIPATPVTATGSQAGYIFSAPAAMPPFDLSNVTSIVWRVQALTTPAGAFVQPILQTAPPEDAAYAFGVYPAQVPLTAAMFAPMAWVDVAIDVAAAPGGGAGGGADAGADAGDAGGGSATLTAFDKSKTRTIGLNVGAGATATAGWVSVELDSVTVMGASNFTSKTFDTGVDTLGLNMYQVPPGTLPPAAK